MYCSFCGKFTDEVSFMLNGPAVYICDECIELCWEMLQEHREKERARFLLIEYRNCFLWGTD